MLTHGNLLFVTVSWLADLMPLDVDDVTLHAAPLTHGAGFHALAATARGAHQVIAEGQRFDATRLLELIEDAGVTNTWMVPTQVMRLVTAQLSHPRDLSRLRWILYGGAPFHEEDLRQAVDVLGPVLIQVYAQGETPMTGSYLPPRAHLDGKPGVLTSAGYARTGMEMSIHDQEDREVACGGIGEIVIRGPTVMKGYWERVAESEETLRGGWLHTGDLGRMDEHGYVYVLDRTKDLIISGGANVYAREVEEVLMLHRDVAAAAVFGVPDRQWGERVVAAIVLRKPVEALDAEVLREHCRRRMAGYKRPKEFHFMAEFPVSAYGKVLKKELRRRFAGPSGAAEGGGG
jgi:acyl-CoA synthetase (AMP-forming)/AMP-acid ligase II